MKTISEMTEQDMREANVPWFNSLDELNEYITQLVSKNHDYGTCVYAMSMAALATYYYVSNQLGVSGFQASCADMDFIKRSRRMKYGFSIRDNDKLLYPQYKDEVAPSYEEIIETNKDWLKEEARKKLEDSVNVHPKVKAHWEWLSKL